MFSTDWCAVRSNLHLSETILRVVTAAVSPLILFLYIFSPCWFLLNLVLMMLRMAHSTTWSDLERTVRKYYCLKTGEERRLYPVLQRSLQTKRQHLEHCLLAPGWTNFRQLTH